MVTEVNTLTGYHKLKAQVETDLRELLERLPEQELLPHLEEGTIPQGDKIVRDALESYLSSTGHSRAEAYISLLREQPGSPGPNWLGFPIAAIDAFLAHYQSFRELTAGDVLHEVIGAALFADLKLCWQALRAEYKEKFAARLAVRVDQAALLSTLTALKPVIAKRSTLPIIQAVKLETSGQDGITLSATDLEMAATAFIPALVKSPGSVAVPFSELLEMVKNHPQAQAVNLEGSAQGHSVTSRHDYGSTTLEGLDASEFPDTPKVESEDSFDFTLPVSIIKEVVAKISFCASDDQSRPVFTSVATTIEANRITFTAADSFRLGTVTYDLATGYSGLARTILFPAATLKKIAGILPKWDTVRITVSEKKNHAIFTNSAGLTLATRLIEGTYPNIEAIIPKSATTTASVPRADLLAGIKALKKAAEQVSNILRFTFSEEGLRLVVKKELEHGKFTEDQRDVPLRTFTGETLEICFNALYLDELALAQKDALDLQFELNSPTKPALITPLYGTSTATQASFRYVVMPMHTIR